MDNMYDHQIMPVDKFHKKILHLHGIKFVKIIKHLNINSKILKVLMKVYREQGKILKNYVMKAKLEQINMEILK
ncbi:hypothetical protein RIR_jg1983.t1 [Rhizophagus irregularis DAOM 181602=DAOM 197198]|uniref:Uncharacterized protein n=1 Tax=Rhizophagus irregularis (strain DAOM 181602 / DAOM 197198 / MUCL 43194) TaxID=747089 RepID=U9TRQ4_RHIID|nr:hypothetical protein RIR_jg1983.t1 [Rhizophagus irregularis DAOM 181602=DAOM 197198]